MFANIVVKFPIKQIFNHVLDYFLSNVAITCVHSDCAKGLCSQARLYNAKHCKISIIFFITVFIYNKSMTLKLLQTVSP